MLRETEQIVCRNPEVPAKQSNIFDSGLVFPAFNVGYLSLRHIDCLAQLCLIQLVLFPQQPYFFTEGQFHLHHRCQFIIDGNFLFTFRQLTSIIYVEVIYLTLEQEQKLHAVVQQDTLYQQFWAECQALEEPFTEMRNRLTPDDRAILDRYISLCEDLEYRRTCLAMDMANE